MIDNPKQAEQLIARLMAALPLGAIVTPGLAATIRAQSPSGDAPRRCSITWVSYSGDEGGIVCRLDLGREESAKAFFVSITHLAFDPRAPLAREIVAYQKHRIKRLRRLGKPASSDLEDHEGGHGE